jgi:hypothetical protein
MDLAIGQAATTAAKVTARGRSTARILAAALPDSSSSLASGIEAMAATVAHEKTAINATSRRRWKRFTLDETPAVQLPDACAPDGV